MERYICKECGAQAQVDSTGIKRSCAHTGIILLDIQVTCYGEGSMQRPSRIARLVSTIIALLKWH